VGASYQAGKLRQAGKGKEYLGIAGRANPGMRARRQVEFHQQGGIIRPEIQGVF
jgi:hypothetical protein